MSSATCPSSFYRSGMMLLAVPPAILPQVKTIGSKGVTAPSDHGVQRHSDFTGNRHRVDCQMRHRGMAATPSDFDCPGIYGRQQRPSSPAIAPALKLGKMCSAERGIGFGIRIE